MTVKLHRSGGKLGIAGVEPSNIIPPEMDLKAGRRAFMQSVGLGLAGSALLGAATAQPAVAQQAISDLDILNFALNLEYLEAEFYLRAAYGTGLTDGEVSGGSQAPQPNTLGPVSGGRQVPFATAAIRNYAIEIATEERLHVNFLRGQLGENRVARPALDIGNAFAVAAQAAGLGGGFDAYANDSNFLLAAFIFEDVGVSAYLGAATLISSKAVLGAAGAILAAEAYHAGTIRTSLYGRNLQIQAQAISNLRDNVDNTAPFQSSDDDQGIGTANTGNTSLTDPSNGLAYPRTTRNVLNIVYLDGSGTATSGGFFPAGLNGRIR